MSVFEFDLQPTDRQIRQFGTLCMLALPLAGWYWSGDRPGVVAGCTVVGLLLFAAGLRFPGILKPLYVALLVIAIPVGIIVGEFVTLLIYFGVFVPIGMVFRFTGRDRLQLRLDRKASSYWQPKTEPEAVARYYHQS